MTIEVERLTSKVLADVPHGFLGRRGGVSRGIYSGLNVGWGSEDERSAIAENRQRAIDSVLPGSSLVTVHQVHSADVLTITAALTDDRRPQADAIVTDRPGLLLGILTADCVPVLFADPQAGIVGAAHAGWKGALAGVTDTTIAAMEVLGARRDRISCAIGPCIARVSYEVGEDFVARFTDADPANERFFSDSRPGHAQFDIEAYVAARLAAAGIEQVEALGENTCAQPERFFSYRRSCLRREPSYGRQISLIGLPVS